jgi:hypothetical protein
MTIDETITDATIDATIDETTQTTLEDSAARWDVPTPTTTVFDWDYTGGRDNLLRLYDKGTRNQWVGSDRIDWSIDVDPTNPVGVPDAGIAISDSRFWPMMTEAQRAEVRRQQLGWQFSQFLHGEQGALVCTSKIVSTVPQLDAKFYAATQVVDEARHVEVFNRYVHDKLRVTYPINHNLKTLLDQGLNDARWDFAYLAMQVIIEGLALAAFGLIRNMATDPLGRSLLAYVMQDEGRHVMFGRLVLRDYYPQLSQRERDEREEFVVEACYRMRDRFLLEEVWERLDLPVAETVEHVRNSETQQLFRSHLFSRIVPVLKDIGLWGPQVQNAFIDMGVMGYADADIEEIVAEDEAIALEFDRERNDHVAATIELGRDR